MNLFKFAKTKILSKIYIGHLHFKLADFTENSVTKTNVLKLKGTAIVPKLCDGNF